jgi:hypothetical protein
VGVAGVVGVAVGDAVAVAVGDAVAVGNGVVVGRGVGRAGGVAVAATGVAGTAARTTAVPVGAGGGATGAAQADRSRRSKVKAAERCGRAEACMAADSPSRRVRRQQAAGNTHNTTQMN